MSILRSSFPDVVIPERNLTQHVLRHASSRADEPAFVEINDDGRTLTYGAFATAVRRLAGGLKARGVGPGTTWALMATNGPEFATVFHALSWAGATVTTLNPTYQAEEVAGQLRDAAAKAIVTVGPCLDVARAAAAAAGVDDVFLMKPGGEAPSIETIYGEELATPVSVDPAEHVVALPYSSGTTGFPKGVMLTHRNLVANLVQIEESIPQGEDDKVFAVLPFFHIYGMTVLMNHTLATGGTVVTAPRFDLVQMLEGVQAAKLTVLYLVPPIVTALAKHPVVEHYDLSSVRMILSGAAPLSGELAEAAAARVGCPVIQGYGMTEMSPVSHAVPRDDYRAGSVGTLVPNTEARLVDPDTGEDVAAGAGRGELWVRGPQVMKGYFGHTAATAATLDAEGWLHTGDIATVDADGHFFVVDRLKELIKVKGFQVAPAELEAILVNLDGVADAAVVGVPDEACGEVPKAFIVRAPESDVTVGSIQAEVAARVATYKHVREVEFVASIPKSASGKILRRALRDRRNQ
ncbi:MAG: AMP-binding protein [Myxococcota bacterium]